MDGLEFVLFIRISWQEIGIWYSHCLNINQQQHQGFPAIPNQTDGWVDFIFGLYDRSIFGIYIVFIASAL